VRLVVEQGNRVGQEFVLDERVATIGRSAENNLVLLEHGVSRHHARLQRDPQGWLVLDQGSTNGTYINGQPLPAHEPYLLRPGDRIALGNAVLAFYETEPSAEPEAPPDGGSEQPPRRLHPALMLVGAVGLIVVLAGLVFLLVMVLQPDQAPPTPTGVEPLEHMLTALPLPTGLDDVVTAIAPLLPTGLPLPQLGGTPTPTP